MDDDKNQLLKFPETVPEDFSPPPYVDVSPVVVHRPIHPQHHQGDVAIGEFDRNSPAYRTCCCHVTVGSMVFAILDLIFAKVTLVVLIVSLINLQRDDMPVMVSSRSLLVFWVIFALAILQITFSWLILYGVRKGRKGLLVPDMVLKGFYVAGAVVSVMFSVWLLVVNVEVTQNLAASDDPNAAPAAYVMQFGTAIISGALVYYLLLIGYYAYYFTVLQRCYRYLQAKKLHKTAQNVTVYKVEMAGNAEKPALY